VNGVNAPAWAFVVPAVNDGAKRVGSPQPTMSNAEEGMASGVNGALHGDRSLVVVNVPHVEGVTSGARGPPLNLSRRSSNGSCGRGHPRPTVRGPGPAAA